MLCIMAKLKKQKNCDSCFFLFLFCSDVDQQIEKKVHNRIFLSADVVRNMEGTG